MDKKRIPIDENRFLELMTIKVIFTEIHDAYMITSGDPEDLGLKVTEIMKSYSDFLFF